MLVVISVEFGIREFDSHLALAHKLASKGFSCLLLHDQLAKTVCKLLASSEHSYILVDKAASVSCIHKRISYNKKGPRSLCYILNQESFVNISPSKGDIFLETTLGKYYDPLSYNLLDRVFTFGDHSSKVIESIHPRLSSKITSTGSPRLDLLHNKYEFFYKQEADALSLIYGDYILFNDAHLLPETNTSPGQIDLDIPKAWKADKDYLSAYQIWRDEQTLYNRKFVPRAAQLLNAYALKYPNKNIIVRPHPNNTASLWSNALKPSPNIHIINIMAVEPWILSADLVLTDGCTTGIQALCANKRCASIDIVQRAEGHRSTFKELARFHVSKPDDIDALANIKDRSFSFCRDSSTLSSIMLHDGDAIARIAEIIHQDAIRNGLVDLAYKNVGSLDFSRLDATRLPWKWQPIHAKQVAFKINTLNRHTNSSVEYKAIGFNSYSICPA